MYANLCNCLMLDFCCFPPFSAAMHAFEQQKRNLSDSQLESKVHVTSTDMAWALKEVKPSAMREVEIDVPKVFCNIF